MAKKLTGMEIFKLLPRTNCGECGVPTCMAFAMKLAQKNAELSACPYASDQAKNVIGAASEPPVRLVTFGSGERAVAMGNELVMFRHDKTFVHQTAIAIRLESDNPSIAAIAKKLDAHTIERAGEQLAVEAVCINDSSNGTDAYCASVKQVAEYFTGGIIIKSGSAARLKAAAETIAGRIPLLHAISKENFGELADFVIAKKLPVVIHGQNLDEAFELSGILLGKGHRDIVLDVAAPGTGAAIQANTIARRAALSSSVRELGYPLMNSVTGSADAGAMVADASALMCKYASLLVIDKWESEALLPLLMLRQNIYTDPQKPIQVEPKIYQLGEATPASPLLVTTNFSLTYFIVSGEVESSGVPANLAVVDAEGLSVLTAWAAGKFSAEKIAAFIKSQPSFAGMTNRKLVIPGYVASLSGELEEKMAGWEILVGPQEASDIGPFMKRLAQQL
ncbi:MAG: acetyl-CoA decarbonylase/synthase complex subunit gamma [Chitinispirillaceae bacterium]|jgi:acetyl-CoA decarbonylase/synthase complex subunit gamma|nr:acetyl-CoA decarbonylase/synthase complex subunit gamma [Chitinispirillaceae bacterium]